MSDLKAIQPSILRLDTSRMSEYLYSDRPTLSPWQKFSRTMGKIGTVALPVGAAVMAFINPIAAAAMYGTSIVAKDATNVALSKDAAAMQAYNAEVAQKPVSIPGFAEAQSPSEVTTDFIAPSEFQTGINRTVNDSQEATQDSLQNFQID